MKIRNLKIGKNFKVVAPYVLVATLSFAGYRTIINYIIRDDMPVYSIEKLTRVESMGDYSSITIENKEETYTPDLLSYREPTNKIVEYGVWEEETDHFERNIDIYETDMKKKNIKEILKSELSVQNFMNKTSTITEISNKKTSNKENVHKEAYIYKYQKDRELTEKEQEQVDSVNNKIALFASTLLTLTLCCSNSKSKKQTNKEKIRK